MSRSDSTGKYPDKGNWCGCIREICEGNCEIVEHEKLLEELKRLKTENERMRHWIGLDRCGDCIKCENDEIDVVCPFAGEPDGCNNRDCRAYVLEYGKGGVK